MSSIQDHPDGDTPRTPEVSGVGFRLAPIPIVRPPVDPESQGAFGGPPRFTGSFLGAEKYRDRHEYVPRDIAPGPVQAEAFGRPYAAVESLQWHPIDAGKFDAGALLLGFTGGWIGRKTAEVVEAFTTSKVRL